MIVNLPITVTKELLLDRNSQERYMEHYLGVPITNKSIKSPLRIDNSPTCSFYKTKSGELRFKDFRTGDNFNFINIVEYKFNCSYYKALKIIANDFNIVKFPKIPINKSQIPEYTNTILSVTNSAKINITLQKYTQPELKWWASFGISKKTLEKFKVFSCLNVFLNDNYLTSNTTTDFIFGYYRGKNSNEDELWRIYFPKRKKYRFLSNWSSTMIQGWNQLPKTGDLLVITKSLKDVMCLYEFGINAIAPNSETTFVTDSQLKKLRKRFKNIIIFYDNDLAGINHMNKFRKLNNLDYTYIPKDYKVKDISDFHLKYGETSTKMLINEFLEYYNGKKT